MSTLDASPKGAGLAHLSAPAVIVIGDVDCGRIEGRKIVEGIYIWRSDKPTVR